MCGIAGIWSPNSDPSKIQGDIDTMISALSHRGPDGNGRKFLNSMCLAFAHTRLSVLDTSTKGGQPMTYRDRYTITYNGEIFNFVELRTELESLGYQFYTDCDTEVLIAAYAEWGEKCQYKLNGMWAFAIWDSDEKRLFLSRDRYGIKPLYFTSGQSSFFAFASELCAFKKLNGFEPLLSNNNICQYLTEPNEPESQGITIYSNIQQLKPGHCITLRNARDICEWRWWSQYEHLVDVPEEYNKQVDIFSELLYDSCRLRLRSHVPIASALSGGLDSSSIYSILRSEKFCKLLPASKFTNDFHKAFFVSFPNSACDEREYVDEVLRFHEASADILSHTNKNLPELIKSTTLHFDSIYDTPIACITPLYEAISSAGYKVSLDGHGVDEMLFGYPQMLMELCEAAKIQGNQEYANSVFSIWCDITHDPRSPTALSVEKMPFLAKCRILLGRLRKKIFHVNDYSLAENYIGSDPIPPYGYDKQDAISGSYFFKKSLPSILRNFDRASMLHGVEIRMPFMDYRLVSYVFSLPTDSKLRNGFTKAILRDSVDGIVPDLVRLRKWKVGISSPLVEWFLQPSMREFICDEVGTQEFQESNLWNGKLWKKRVNDFHSAADWEHHATTFWRIFNAHLLISNHNSR